MIGKRTLLIAALLLASASAAAAQSVVNIQLRQGEQPEDPRVIEVTPNASAVCRNTVNCPTALKFRWVGNTGSDTTQRIRIEYKDGLFWGEDGTPSRVAPHVCFEFAEGERSFELEPGGEGHDLVFRSEAEDCPDKVAFFFDISCQNAAGDNCGGVETLDPGTMVDNGKRGG